ncbi:hypothetical protein BD309DRAFT_1024572 [Dichomitus squalens]|nr:hypothetical protein BD309DRAFT_1024572 [Dichomitus squalens]
MELQQCLTFLAVNGTSELVAASPSHAGSTIVSATSSDKISSETISRIWRVVQPPDQVAAHQVVNRILDGHDLSWSILHSPTESKLQPRPPSNWELHYPPEEITIPVNFPPSSWTTISGPGPLRQANSTSPRRLPNPSQ